MTNSVISQACKSLKEQLLSIFVEKGLLPDMKVKIDEEITIGHIYVKLLEQLSFIIIIHQNYPIKPPLLILHNEFETESIPLHWDENLTVNERIRHAVDMLLNSKLQIAYGTTNGLPLTTDKEKAELAGWQPSFTGEDPSKTREEIQSGIFARTLGVLSKDVMSKRVLIIGVGSVGSYISEQLVRSGLGKLTIIDPDVVEYANLSRTVYTLQDVNRPKVLALARHLYNINPSIELQYYQKDITMFETADLLDVFSQSDVVVATTDDPQAQRVINRFAYGKNKPAVYIGLYQGADGGEVILSLPEKTPCYQCSTSVRHELERSTEIEIGVKTDYGTGKLQGVVALGADIHHVSSAAVKIILSLLIPDESEVSLSGFMKPAVEQEFTYLTFSMKDQYWFYPHIFHDTPGQYAYQSVWLSPSKRENCPVCGEEEHRYRLEEGIVHTPSLSNIRKALDE